ncbi:FAD:protein FMN transferase [Microbacterium sp. SSM24]|uniref:FAD:protein FMN transferase n=1 Tax=Microbacterium sp. SSM24 TaxID=2991714 RepID=UPI00222796C8|nr:FAD:protein FMN transferase [Microbacterium sp. SSM24]MCW3493331.1 FAD:protein FMN transferase [Microbacterium sp. SSM24]
MNAPGRRVEVSHIMGTAVSVHVIGRADDPVVDAAIEACFDELCEADRVFSMYRPDSDLRRVAAGELAAADASTDLSLVAAACAQAELDTGGLFSARFSGSYDPTGYVKGWSVERAARRHLAPLLDLSGVMAVGINAGGDLQLFTSSGASWTWDVGIVDPVDRSRVLATVPVRNGAVATSGPAERGAHVIDPRTALPASGVISATLIAAGLARADVWATAAVVSGFEDLSWIGRAGQSTGMIVGDDGRVRRWIDGVEVTSRLVGGEPIPDRATGA